MIKTSELIWQDKQHQKLFELIEQINSPELDPSVFRQLCDYAEHHFVLEEEYMVRLDYPHTEAHIAAHDKFRAELDSMMKNLYQYDHSFRETLSLFLSEWLKGHVLGIDKDLEAFILKSGYK